MTEGVSQPPTEYAVMVLVPNGFEVPPQLWERCAVLRYEEPYEAARMLALPHSACALVTDGLSREALEFLSVNVAATNRACVEVRSHSWDGETHSPLSAVARGVVSGFGPRGVLRAVELLERVYRI